MTAFRRRHWYDKVGLGAIVGVALSVANVLYSRRNGVSQKKLATVSQFPQSQRYDHDIKSSARLFFRDNIHRYRVLGRDDSSLEMLYHEFRSRGYPHLKDPLLWDFPQIYREAMGEFRRELEDLKKEETACLYLNLSRNPDVRGLSPRANPVEKERFVLEEIAGELHEDVLLVSERLASLDKKLESGAFRGKYAALQHSQVVYLDNEGRGMFTFNAVRNKPAYRGSEKGISPVKSYVEAA